MLSTTKENDDKLHLQAEDDCSAHIGEKSLTSTKLERASKEKVKLRVAFGDVRCRLYHRTVGLHPAVSSGPALDFTWNYECTDKMKLDEYEASKETPLYRTELIIPKFEREKILISQCDVSKFQIAAHVRKINRTKAERRQTLNNLHFAPIEEVLEKFQHRLSRALLLRRSFEKEVEILIKKTSELLERSISSSESTQKTTNSSLDATLQSLSTTSIPSRIGPFSCCKKVQVTSVLDQGRHNIQYDLSDLSTETEKCTK